MLSWCENDYCVVLIEALRCTTYVWLRAIKDGCCSPALLGMSQSTDELCSDSDFSVSDGESNCLRSIIEMEVCRAVGEMRQLPNDIDFCWLVKVAFKLFPFNIFFVGRLTWQKPKKSIQKISFVSKSWWWIKKKSDMNMVWFFLPRRQKGQIVYSCSVWFTDGEKVI